MSSVQKACSESEIDEVMTAWLAQVRVVRRRRAELATAIHRMPWWAQPGPTQLYSDGTCAGTISWQPAIKDIKPSPYKAGYRLIRASGYDIRRMHGSDPFGSQQRRDALLEASLAAYKDRLAAQKIEMDRAGVTAARDADHKADIDLGRLQVVIHDGAPSPLRLAARTIFHLAYRVCGDLCFSKQSDSSGTFEVHEAAHVLRNLIPVLPPVMAATATRILKPGAGVMARSPIWLGHHELSPIHEFGHLPAHQVAEHLAERRAQDAQLPPALQAAA